MIDLRQHMAKIRSADKVCAKMVIAFCDDEFQCIYYLFPVFFFRQIKYKANTQAV